MAGSHLQMPSRQFTRTVQPQTSSDEAKVKSDANDGCHRRDSLITFHFKMPNKVIVQIRAILHYRSRCDVMSPLCVFGPIMDGDCHRDCPRGQPREENDQTEFGCCCGDQLLAVGIVNNVHCSSCGQSNVRAVCSFGGKDCLLFGQQSGGQTLFQRLTV